MWYLNSMISLKHKLSWQTGKESHKGRLNNILHNCLSLPSIQILWRVCIYMYACVCHLSVPYLATVLWKLSRRVVNSSYYYTVMLSCASRRLTVVFSRCQFQFLPYQTGIISISYNHWPSVKMSTSSPLKNLISINQLLITCFMVFWSIDMG